MDPQNLTYAEWHKIKRRQQNAETQRQKRARLKADQSANALVVTKALNSYPGHFQRATSEHALILAQFALKELHSLDVDAKRMCMEKFILHPLVRDFMPQYLLDLKTLKHQPEVIENIRSGIVDQCSGSWKSFVLEAKNIVIALASSQCISSAQGIK